MARLLAADANQLLSASKATHARRLVEGFGIDAGDVFHAADSDANWGGPIYNAIVLAAAAAQDPKMRPERLVGGSINVLLSGRARQLLSRHWQIGNPGERTARVGAGHMIPLRCFAMDPNSMGAMPSGGAAAKASTRRGAAPKACAGK